VVAATAHAPHVKLSPLFNPLPPTPHTHQHPHHPQHVSLADALCGGQLQVRTLDGRPLDVPLTNVVTPGSARVMRGEGMPISKTGGKGDLRIKFEISFPRQLTPEQKQQLRGLLTGAV